MQLGNREPVGAFFMRKLIFMMREGRVLIREHKMYFLAPLLIVLALIAILVYSIGPTVITTFIYAGI